MNTSTSDLAASGNAGEIAGPDGNAGEIAGSEAPPTASGSTERAIWWIAFGVLTFGAVALLALWN